MQYAETACSLVSAITQLSIAFVIKEAWGHQVKSTKSLKGLTIDMYFLPSAVIFIYIGKEWYY